MFSSWRCRLLSIPRRTIFRYRFSEHTFNPFLSSRCNRHQTSICNTCYGYSGAQSWKSRWWSKSKRLSAMYGMLKTGTIGSLLTQGCQIYCAQVTAGLLDDTNSLAQVCSIEFRLQNAICKTALCPASERQSASRIKILNTEF